MLIIFQKRLLLLGLLLIFSVPGLAQSPTRSTLQCGTTSLSPTERRALEAEAALAFRLKKASMATARLVPTITYVPIRPHILRRTNGTGGYDLRMMNNVMALANKKWFASGIQFFFSGTTPNYINDDALFTGFTKGTSEAVIRVNNATNAMNMYHIPVILGSTAAGYAFYPGNTITTTESYIKNTGGLEDYLGNSLVPHELGHNFNLAHTFEEDDNGREKVDGSNCSTAGDLVCDTPADPYGWAGFPSSDDCVVGCPSTYTCNFTEAVTGLRYNPIPNNIMSYYAGACQTTFTSGQNTRVQAGLATRQAHTAYSLTALSTNVMPVSNLTATLVGGRPVLTWTDNAGNEMGYFIERSLTSSADGFVPIGGVATNATSYTDTEALSSVTAYYRIRPSNSTGNLSAVATLQIPLCVPSFAFACSDYTTGIGSFTVNGQTLSQNTGCSVGSYGQFTAVTPSVSAGNGYPFTVAPINAVNGMRYSIWVDLNRNGSFADPGEMLFQSSSNSTAPVSGTLSIPVSASVGIARLRIIVKSGSTTSPDEPCGSYTYGEAEDYQLNITPNSLPTVQGLAATTSTVCVGNVATFTATLVNVSGTYDFTLTNGSSPISGTGTATAFSQTLTTSGGGGVQTLTLTVGVSGTTGWGSTTLNVAALPTAAISLPTPLIINCLTSTRTLTATGGGTYLWDNASTAASRTINASGTYSVTVTSAGGCSSTASQLVTVTQDTTPPTVALSTSNICAGSVLTLSATAGLNSYTFVGAGGVIGSGTGNTTTVSGLAAGNPSFTVLASGPNGCTATQTTSATVEAQPTLAVAATPSFTISTGQTVTITASGGTSYTWVDGSTGASFTASPASTTAYSVTGVNASGCASVTSATVSVTVPAPTVNSLAATNGTVCVGSVATFTATLGNVPGTYSFTLTNGTAPVSGTGTGTAFSQTITTSGAGGVGPPGQTFTLTIGIIGASGSGSATLVVGAIPTAGLVASGAITCNQPVVTLTASGGATYVFAGAGLVTSSGNSATANAAGTYSVTVTGASGCTSTTTTTVSSSTAAPVVGVTVSGPITCLSPSVTLIASGGASYVFAGPGIVSTGANSAVVSVSGVYSVTGTVTSTGCFSSTTITVTGSATGTIPTVSLIGSGSAVCAGGNMTIAATVSGSATYSWYRNGQLVSNVAPPLLLGGVQRPQAGSYVLGVVSDCGSATSTAFVLTVKPQPTVVITFPSSASVQTANGFATVTVPQSTGLSYLLTGGVLYSRHVLIDRINGYELKAYWQTTDGLFAIDHYGPYSIRVLGANGCERVVEGEVKSN